MTRAYVLENINAKGQYLAKDMDAAFESDLESGDVTDVKQAMQFDDVYDLMCWSAESGMHKATMEARFGRTAMVTNDIGEVLRLYRPKEITL